MSAVVLQERDVRSPGVAPAADGTSPVGTSPTFAQMAAFVLRSRQAQALLGRIQVRLSAAFLAVGLTMGQWSSRPTRRDISAAVSLKSVLVTDPLNEARYEVLLWLSVRQVGAGSAFHIRAEARDVASGRIFGQCDPVTRSWGALELNAFDVAMRQAFVELTEDPAPWEGTHFEDLAAALSVARAP